MGDIAHSDRLSGGLSQLKKSLRKVTYLFKKAFSGFVFTWASFFGVFPALPEVNPEAIVSQGNKTEVKVVETPEEENGLELCLWQKDVLLFESLEDEKNTLLQKEKPCLEQQKKLAEEAKKNSGENELSLTIETMAAGYPLAVMAPTISQYDREVAALIVGIAKKESNWGKRVPRSEDGADCYNYWGYKGAGTRGVAMGHGCFGSPEEAVNVVGKRLTQLVELRKTSEPKNMIIWKCGSSCATHSPESVKKWIADVDLYYRKIVNN